MITLAKPSTPAYEIPPITDYRLPDYLLTIYLRASLNVPQPPMTMMAFVMIVPSTNGIEGNDDGNPGDINPYQSVTGAGWYSAKTF